MLVSDVKRKVSRLIGDDDNLMCADADYIDWTNEALLRIAREEGIDNSATSFAANTYPVTLANNYLRTKTVVYGAVYLQRTTTEELELQNLNVLQTGIPYAYYMYAPNTMGLFPKPVTSDITIVTHSFSIAYPALTALANTIPTPMIYDDDVCHFVRSRAYQRVGRYDQAENAMGEFLNGRGSRTQEATVQDDSNTVILDDPRDFE